MWLEAVSLTLVGLKKEDSVKNVIIQALAEEWPLTVKQISQKARQNLAKSISYQAIHKAVRELAARKALAVSNKRYSLNHSWLQEIEAFARLTLDKYSEKYPKIPKPASQQCKLSVYDSADMFYTLMIPLLRNESEFRFSSKSPSLVISKEESQTPARKKYVEELKRAIEERGAKIKYLISKESTKEMILKNRDKAALENLKKFSNSQNTKIKCAPTKAVMSYAVARKDFFLNPTAITNFAPVAVIHFRGKDMSAVQRVFDIIFAEADEADCLIEEIEKDLSRRRARKKKVVL